MKAEAAKTTPNTVHAMKTVFVAKLKVEKQKIEELDKTSRAKAYRLLGPIEKAANLDCWCTQQTAELLRLETCNCEWEYSRYSYFGCIFVPVCLSLLRSGEIVWSAKAERSAWGAACI